MSGRLCGILIALVLGMPVCQAAPLDPSTCVPVALATNDNDIRLDDDPRRAGKRTSLPRAVLDKIQSAGALMLAHTDPDLGERATCEMFGPVYRVSGYGSAQLFVAEATVPTAVGYFILILHDPATGAVTRDPPWIGSKWPGLFGANDPLVKRPFVSKGDLRRDGRRQVVFEERVHNGNIYNGTVYHHFDIGADLALTRVLSLETRVVSLDDDALFVREIVRIAANRLRLELYKVPFPSGGPRRSLGHAILEAAGPGTPFRVTERHPGSEIYAHQLVTFCETARDDDTFLRDGCNHYY